MTTQEENKLIAAFMGLEPFENPFRGITKDDGLYVRVNADETKDIVGDLNYNISWDWLMPVVEKIEQCVVKINITSRVVIIRVGLIDDDDIVVPYKESGLTKLEGVWRAVVAFVKEHSINKTH